MFFISIIKKVNLENLERYIKILDSWVSLFLIF